MWVPELLIPHKLVRMFGPKTAIFAPKYAFGAHIGLAGSFGALLVFGCSARAVSRNTPIYFMLSIHVTNILILLGSLVVSRKIIELCAKERYKLIFWRSLCLHIFSVTVEPWGWISPPY